ncbi:MAG: LTA synthase family protein [Bdellovibrionia bacterium]
MLGVYNRLLVFIKWVLWALLVYILIRIEFFIWNHSSFAKLSSYELLVAWASGLRFDLSSVAAVSLPVFLIVILPTPQRWARFHLELSRWFFVLLHSLFFVINQVDVEFVNFVGRRFSYEGLFILSEIPGKMGGFLSTYGMLFFVNTLMLVCFVWAIFKVPLLTHQRFFSFWKSGALLLCSLVLMIVAIRGGLQRKPLTFVNANVSSVPMVNNFVLNSTFTFIKGFSQLKLKEHDFFENQQAAFAVAVNPVMQKRWSGLAGSNVMILVLESFSSEYTGASGEKSYTPFLDSLATESLFYSHGIANARRSIEGIAAITAALPALMNEPFISSSFTANRFEALPRELLKHGYTTSFYHGGLNGTMHFDAFAASAGFENYFGYNEFPDKSQFDGVWGIWDKPFMSWVVSEHQDKKKPFLSLIFTLSSHHPYRVPTLEEELYPEGEIPILKTVRYTDDALRIFFDEARKQPWFEDTLFVITADHTSTHFRQSYKNYIGDYQVPILFYHPKMKWSQKDAIGLASHVDIAPTIFDFLGVEPSWQIPFGKSLLREGENVTVNYLDNKYFVFSDSYFGISEELSQIRLFSMNDKEMRRPVVDEAEQKKLLNKLKGKVQYFNNGMIQNQFYLDR